MKHSKLLILKVEVNRRAMRYIKLTAGSSEISRILALFLIFSPLVASAAIYQWRDADGTMVYSQIPPADGRAIREVKPPPPPAESPEQAQQRLQNLRQRAEDDREDRRLAAEKAAKAASKDEILRKNCEGSRRNLQQLEQKNRPVVSDGKGGMRRMTPAEREQKLEQYRRDVKKFCR